MNLTKEQWEAAIAIVSFIEGNNESDHMVKSIAGEYVIATEEEQKELLTSIGNDIDVILPVLLKLRKDINNYLKG